MPDHFDEDLKRSLATQASRVPGTHDLGRSAITQARSIRRRRQVVGAVAAAAMVAIAVPVGLQVGDAVTRTQRQLDPATSNTAPSEGPTSATAPTTEPEPTSPSPTATEPATSPSPKATEPPRTISGPTRIDIDFATLPAADEPPLVPYVEGRSVVIGDTRLEVDAKGEVVGAAAFDGGAHVYMSDGTGRLVRVTDAGTEELGAAAGGPIASPDLRWNAYAIGATDKFGNVERGITLAIFDSATGSTSTVQLPAANSVRMLALVDGTVYYKPERPDGTRQPMSSWAAGEESPTVVAGSYDATALSWDGRVVAALTEVTDFGSCTQVVDRTSGSALMDTCDHSVLGLSPDGSFAWAGPAYLDGYSIGDLALLDTRTGEVIRRLPSFDNGVEFMDATFEDADHLLIRAEQRDQTALVRCTVSTGDCELATPPADGTSDIGGSPYRLAG